MVHVRKAVRMTLESVMLHFIDPRGQKKSATSRCINIFLMSALRNKFCCFKWYERWAIFLKILFTSVTMELEICFLSLHNFYTWHFQHWWLQSWIKDNFETHYQRINTEICCIENSGPRKPLQLLWT